MKELALNLPGPLAFYPGRLTPRDELTRLISRLRPTPCRASPLIRLGPDGDGGYLVPDDLEGIEACFSPGVGPTSEFERACANRGMSVYMADGSVEGPVGAHPSFHFRKEFIGSFAAPGYLAVDSWVQEELETRESDLMLQMDIEGAEFEVIHSISEELMKRFRVIIVEFHKLEGLFCEPLFQFMGRAFEKLLQTHTCVHIHPNNCAPPRSCHGLTIPWFAEFTFHRSNRVREPELATQFPHPLDRDCSPADSPQTLPHCWYADRNR